MASYEPFRRRMVMLAAATVARVRKGVHVAAIELDDGPPRLQYEPGSPFADANGYVGYPNINIVVEQMNMMEAQRSYEANITAAEATKSMISVALQMLA
jgi:flagellar basal-body rod protein FlgC